ncbi:MAG: AAA family ATPase [Sulfuriferula sp.]|nr:AAA family ATPase [Sulfuriferula sp.]
MITVVGNLKGGSGKSMIAFNLAVWLATQQREVHLLDLDPQKTLTDLVEVRAEESCVPELRLLDETTPLASLSAMTGEIIVDIGAANLAGMYAAITLAQRVLIPVVPGQADVWSTQRFLRLIAPHRRADGEVLMVLNRTDALGGSKETKEAAAALAMLKSAKLLPTRLGQRVWFCRSLSEGQAVFEMAANERATAEFLALTKLLYPKTRVKSARKGK